MLKKILKRIRRELLKIDWVKREVEAYQTEKEKQAHHEHWARLLHSGCKVRNLKPEKLDICSTLTIVESDGMVQEYLGGEGDRSRVYRFC